MYSEEEKRYFLETMARMALNPNRAQELPGWPTRATLGKWMKDVEQGRLTIAEPLPSTAPKARREQWSVDAKTKKRAIRLYSEGRRPVDIKRALGLRCCPSTIGNWWKRANETGKMPSDKGAPRVYNPHDRKGDPVTKKKKVPPEVAVLTPAELENACLRAVLDDLKAGGFDLLSISNRKKVELGERLRAEKGVALRAITDFLRISKSSYEYHRARLGRPDKYAAARVAVREEFFRDGGRFGYRTVHARLRQREEPVAISEKVVRRIMAEEGLVPVTAAKGKLKWSSYAGEISDAPENLVERSFHASAPNELWLTDITEFKLPDPRQPKVYLSPVIDCFDGMPVAWAIGTRPTAALANESLSRACATRSGGAATIIHSDRGSHYRWPGWIAICEENGLVRSMSKKGCSPDNAACEGFFGRLKNEMFYHRGWRGATAADLIAEIEAYMEYYCRDRIKRSLGWRSPEQYRRDLGLIA